MNPPTRIAQSFVAPAGLAVLAAALVTAAIAGALHPALGPLAVFVVAFPLLWIGLSTFLSTSSARALRVEDVVLPVRLHAMDSFRLNVTFAFDRYRFPALGVLTKADFECDGVVLDAGPWAEIPVLQSHCAGTSQWEVMVKRRGTLRVGPVHAAVEFAGSAIRATAIFGDRHTVTVLPAVYELQPFTDTLLAGRHVAAGRFQKLPVASEEYVGAREYRPGDSPRLIHRILSLRTRDPNEFYVREFQDPSREDVSLVLDTAPPSDGDETLHRYRFEKAISFASALARTFAARRLTVRFVCQRSPREVMALRVRPLDIDLDRLDGRLAHIELGGDHATLGRLLLDEARHHGAAVILISLRQREDFVQLRAPIVILTPEHVPVFTREVASR